MFFSYKGHFHCFIWHHTNSFEHEVNFPLRATHKPKLFFLAIDSFFFFFFFFLFLHHLSAILFPLPRNVLSTSKREGLTSNELNTLSVNDYQYNHCFYCLYIDISQLSACCTWEKKCANSADTEIKLGEEWLHSYPSLFKLWLSLINHNCLSVHTCCCCCHLFSSCGLIQTLTQSSVLRSVIIPQTNHGA